MITFLKGNLSADFQYSVTTKYTREYEFNFENGKIPSMYSSSKVITKSNIIQSPILNESEEKLLNLVKVHYATSEVGKDIGYSIFDQRKNAARYDNKSYLDNFF